MAANLFAQSNHFQGQLLALEHVLKNSDLANMDEQQINAKLEQMNHVKTIIQQQERQAIDEEDLLVEQTFSKEILLMIECIYKYD